MPCHLATAPNSLRPAISKARPKQKTHRPASWWWAALSSKAATGFYPFSLPTPEDTRAPQIQTQHIREFFRGLLNMRVE